MKYQGNTNEYFEILEQSTAVSEALNNPIDGQLALLWFQEDENEVTIDSYPYLFGKDTLICLTNFHQVDVKKIQSAKMLRFNSSFYCIVTHDSEVGCKGILFFGSKSLPILQPKGEHLESLQSLSKMVLLEMQSKDELQQEMLQMLLKRFLILCTRIYKAQEQIELIPKIESDIVRQFNYLVEKHFKEKHTVSEYADLLNKSPKTLSNLFGKFHDKSPLKLIQDRIMLEARRLLRYTEKPVSEIGYDLGFNDIQSFSRFFKKNEGNSPSDFRLV